MNFKPDNNCVNREDIILVSEIITYSRYWLSVAGTPPNLGPILKHITVSAEMQIISIIARIQNIKTSWNLRIIISNSCKQYAISFPWQFVPPLNQEKLTIALFKNFFLQTSFAMPCLINPVFRIRMYPLLSEANLNSEFRYPYNLIAIYYGMNKKSDHAFP